MGDSVYVRDFPSKNWMTGSVSEVKDPLSYHVTLSDGRVVRRHVEHVRSRSSLDTDSSTGNNSDVEISTVVPTSADKEDTAETSQPRRSARDRGPPDYLRY